jgi:hypothetical protein
MLKSGKSITGKKYMSDRRNNPWQRSGKLYGTIQDAIFGNVDNDFEMNDYKKRRIYLNDLGEENFVAYTHTGFKHNILYKHNNLHYRCEDFDKNVDILFSGCSMTYGYGLPVELTFPHIVSNKLNYSYANIGLLSESVSSQVRRTFAYFKKYGHPKYLYAVYPDFGRMEFPTNSKSFITGTQKKITKQDILERNNNLTAWLQRNFLQNAHMPGNLPNLKLSAQPHIAEEVITPEIPHFYSSQLILMLQQYCDIAGIKFEWTTWDQDQYNIMSQFEDFPNIFNLNMDKWIPDYDNTLDNYTDNSSCHSQMREDLGTMFHFGMDREYGIDHAHWGAHRHAHVADIILSRINRILVD